MEWAAGGLVADDNAVLRHQAQLWGPRRRTLAERHAFLTGRAVGGRIVPHFVVPTIPVVVHLSQQHNFQRSCGKDLWGTGQRNRTPSPGLAAGWICDGPTRP